MKRKEKNISLLHSLSHLRAKRTTKDAPLLPAFSLSVYCARKKKHPRKEKGEENASLSLVGQVRLGFSRAASL